jgi:hypothetical protein
VIVPLFDPLVGILERIKTAIIVRRAELRRRSMSRLLLSGLLSAYSYHGVSSGSHHQDYDKVIRVIKENTGEQIRTNREYLIIFLWASRSLWPNLSNAALLL